MLRCCLASLLLATTLAHADTDWGAAARRDMQFAIDTIRTSHAGSVSGQADVLAALEDGGRTGLAEAARVKDAQAYRRAMVRFIAGFGDPHTGINLHLKIGAWTGIVIDRVDKQYRVIWSEPGWPHPLPPQGAVVQSCDGVWTGSYLKTGVAPFLSQSPEYDASPSEAARRAMFDYGLGWTPQGCDVILANGASRHYDLPLRDVADGIGAARIEAVRRQFVAAARPVGLYRLAPGMHWVGMPDFNGKTSGAAYEKLYGELAALKDARWVVFDLRGNGGGDSSWGNRALQALYGTDFGTRLEDAAGYAKRLIADQPTVAVYQRYASLPAFAASKDAFIKVQQQLQAAIEAGEKMAQVEGRSRDEAQASMQQLAKRPGGPRIAAVIDRGCFSSCMNFVQQISAMQDTVVLGEATLGYSPYGEINAFPLPSGNGAITLPSAIYTAIQATREPFVPHLSYPGNLADDAALMRWVAARLAGPALRGK
jgi:hypothetical protein